MKKITFGTELGEVNLNKFWEKKGVDKILTLANELLEKFELEGGAMWLANQIQQEAEEMRQMEIGREKLQEIEDLGILTYQSNESSEVKNCMSFKEAVEFLKVHSPVTYSAFSPGYLGMIKFIENKIVFLDGEMKVVDFEKINPSILLLEDWKICAQAD